MAEKNQINLYLPVSNITLLDTLSKSLEISRSQTVDLLLKVATDALGKDKIKKAIKSKKLRGLVENKFGVKLTGNTRYDYKSLTQ